MKYTFTLHLFLLALPFLSLSQPDSWTQKKDIGYYLTGGPAGYGGSNAGFSIGSSGYFFSSTELNEASDFWEFDSLSGQWSQVADFPGTRRHFPVGFSIGSKGYLGLGIFGLTYYQDFWEYNPATNVWTAKSTFPGNGRAEAVGFAVGTKGYVGLGEGSAGYLDDFWEYNPTSNSWLQRANYPGGARKQASGTGIGTKGYVGLGKNSSNVCFNGLWEFTPTTNTWLVRNSFPGVARAKAIAYTIGTDGFFGLGYDGFNHVIDFYQYNPSGNSWTAKASFISNPQYIVSGFAIANSLYVGLGPANSFWKYSSGTNSWSESSQFGANYRGSPAGFSVNEKVYVCTGNTNPVALSNELWEWDPLSEIWTQKADFPGVSRSQAIGFGISNKGYIGMGTTTGTDALSDFYQYDPSTNTWTAKANFGGGARRGMVAFTIGNKGYAGTGSSNSLTYTDDFWEYDPTLDSWIQKANVGGSARHRAFGFSMNERGYIGGGTTAGGDMTDFWQYNPGTNVWVQKTNIGQTIDRPSGFSLGSFGYVAGGNYVHMSHLTRYNPYTNTWSTMDAMPFGKTGAAAVSTTTHAYFFGGLFDDTYVADFWEYEADNQINIPSLTDNNLCIGDSIHLSYSVLYPFETGNVFTLQLSDANGSFTSPTNIGTIGSEVSGTISAAIPAGIPIGEGYRIRIVSNLPVVISNDNGTDMSIDRFEQIVFTETMGIVSGTTSISTHESSNGFDNDGYTMSGTADVRNTDASTGYGTASGGANVYFSTTGNRTFQIQGINTLGMTDVRLSFGIYKGGSLGSSDKIVVEVSSDGFSYSELSYTIPGVFNGNEWYYRTVSGTIPSTSNLRIRFTQDSFLASNHYRIDDIILTATIASVGITASVPAYFCNGNSVTLTATAGFSYLWSNSETTSAIVTNTPGNYQCELSSQNGCSLSSNTIVLNDTTPQKFNVTGGGTYCSVPGTGLTINLDGSEIGIKYQLMLNGSTPVGAPVSGNGSPISFGLISGVGNYTVTALDTTISCSALMDGSANISVNNAIYFYADQDIDGYGGTMDSVLACSALPGYVANKLDCNDTISSVYPGATEVCNSLDDDCDGFTDETCGTPIYCIGPGSFYVPPSGPSYVNQNSPFATLQAAVTFLNSFPPTQHVIFEIQNNYTGSGESFPIVVTYEGNASATAVFRPRIDLASELTISGNLFGSINGLIQLNGADYVTFDGSPGGTMGSNPFLRIRNTRTTAGASPVVTFQNDATYNVLNAMILEGGSTAQSCVLIGGSSGSSGNDFNSIQNCSIRDRSDVSITAPDIGIYCWSLGTGALANSDNIITGNKIQNISDGVKFYTSGNNGNWTISNNHFYFTNSASSKISEAIHVYSTEPLSATISSNYIGGTAPFSGGSALIETSPSLGFAGIYLRTGVSSAKSVVSGNMIRNMQRNSTGTCSFTALSLEGGPVDVLNNVIGSPAVLNDLSFESGADVLFRGIVCLSSQNSTGVSLTGNSINNVKIDNVSGTSGLFTGISYTNTTLDVSTADITGNAIHSVNYNGPGSFMCIFVSPGESSLLSANISGNRIEELSINNPLGGTFTGIHCNRANAIISGNRIGNFLNPGDISVQSAGTHYGIRLNYSVFGSGVIVNDTIVNLTFGNTNATNAFYGIHMQTNGTTLSEVTGNILSDISIAGIKSSVETDPIVSHILTGIYFKSFGIGSNAISANTIQNLHALTVSSLANPVVSAISVGRAGSSVIHIDGNTIHSLRNSGANNSEFPGIIGILMKEAQTEASYVRNNMIALNNAPYNNAVKIYGIYDAVDNGIVGNVKNYFYNSVSISGTGSGSGWSAAFWHNSSSSNLSLRNNIFNNVRNGGAGKQYAIVHETGNAAAWTSTASDHNAFYTADSSTLGAWPVTTDWNYTGWKLNSGGDNNSIQIPIVFIDSATNLHLDVNGNCELDGAALSLAGTVSDIDSEIRDLISPDIGADEFSGICATMLDLKAFIEGFYRGGGMMISAIDSGSSSLYCDTILLQLADAVSPHSILYSDTAILQTNGNVQFVFPVAVSGKSYYLVLKHRNSLEVWSAVPVSLSNGFTYDFSGSAAQVYFSNQTAVDPGIYAIYSGDLNQDGLIDMSDIGLMESSIQVPLFGYYSSDLTGDWYTESSDFSLIENNCGKILLRPY